MNSRVVKPNLTSEFSTDERCFVLEAWNNPRDVAASISRARVEPGVTTQLHRLRVDERYLIVEGTGAVKLGDRDVEPVGVADIVVIPAGMPQQITNTGDTDLIFYCICTPRFTPDCYEPLE
jgi:mannose-6-phosphate isomerase-like protein (cupin superfamily)